MTQRKKTSQQLHRCGDCANVTEVLKPHQLLSLDGKPTLGTCPYWTESRCTLLSWRSDCMHFKPKTNRIQTERNENIHQHTNKRAT